MAYPYNPYGVLPPNYYPQAVPDQLAQLRQSQMQQPQMMQPPQPMQGVPQAMLPQTPMPQAGPVDDRIWVQGEGAATSYLVAANGFVRLWDSTAPVFYEKQADAQGKPLPIVIYDYKRRGEEPAPQAPAPDYNARLEAIEKRLEAVEKKRGTSKQKEIDEA